MVSGRATDGYLTFEVTNVVLDGRMSEFLSLLDRKAQGYWAATRVGEKLLGAFARAMEEHFGYPVNWRVRPIKKWSRISMKAAEILRKDTACTASEAANRIADIAGGRVLVLGLRDLHAAKDQFTAYTLSTRKDLQLWGFEDNVSRSRLGGFRALAGGVFITDTPTVLNQYPFELQIMTPLQDAWDKLQHPVYEKARMSGTTSPPSEVVKWFQQLSYRLYRLDKAISTKQESFRSQGLL
ncbi:MAG: hypothetical protein EXR55_04480 [Dehalococcoidia bacterium]|nr:hypothetical protein [Dehalococcoidia bacterium]